ncbi:hypothetical protein IE81DRAFT_324768 [Ceraceosorus guamensis]|uniref:PHD-type domain-containing protein n=1 Tax=Ceraceosorus guamensis TaxID=1522189 RepID=A0A316VUH0_9BASI|nr:hypothetical protein IE81DRAFT_324768 [Ceraceosorus guamensis]PWN41266.1 hypothetical protein IE81DRAFT_324768 [Ceraceosorus guamensis]
MSIQATASAQPLGDAPVVKTEYAEMMSTATPVRSASPELPRAPSEKPDDPPHTRELKVNGPHETTAAIEQAPQGTGDGLETRPRKKMKSSAFVPWSESAARAAGVDEDTLAQLRAASQPFGAISESLRHEVDPNEALVDEAGGILGEPTSQEMQFKTHSSAHLSPYDLLQSDEAAGAHATSSLSSVPSPIENATSASKTKRKSSTSDNKAAQKSKTERDRTRALVLAEAAASAAAAATLEKEREAEREREAREREEGLGDEDEDMKLYCVCKALYDEERMMIACDRCDEWYHTSCMDMDDAKAELVDMFICPVCEPKTTDRTTWKTKCLRQGCTHAALPPLSRYCGQRCGILVAASRISKTKYAKAGAKATAEKLLGNVVKNATKREGLCVWADVGAPRASINTSSNQELQRWRSKFHPGLGAFDIMANGDNAGVKDDEHALSLRTPASAEAEALHHLGLKSQILAHRHNAAVKTFSMVEARITLLELAKQRISTLPAVEPDEGAIASSTTSTKKSKSKKRDTEEGTKGLPRCGYDERLHWDDYNFHAWWTSDKAQSILKGETALDGVLSGPGEDTLKAQGSGASTICGLAKRKCKRHADWATVREADFEVERELVSKDVSQLAAEIERCKTDQEHWVAAAEASRRAQLAVEEAKNLAVAAQIARDNGMRRVTTLGAGALK